MQKQPIKVTFTYLDRVLKLQSILMLGPNQTLWEPSLEHSEDRLLLLASVVFVREGSKQAGVFGLHNEESLEGSDHETVVGDRSNQVLSQQLDNINHSSQVSTKE